MWIETWLVVEWNGARKAHTIKSANSLENKRLHPVSFQLKKVPLSFPSLSLVLLSSPLFHLRLVDVSQLPAWPSGSRLFKLYIRWTFVHPGTKLNHFFPCITVFFSGKIRLELTYSHSAMSKYHWKASANGKKPMNKWDKTQPSSFKLLLFG